MRASLTPGNVVLVDGPYGVFTKEVATDNRSPVYIAGGIGITPFVSHILNHQKQDDYLFYAVKDVTSAILDNELRQKLGSRMVSVFSSSTKGAVGINIERGRISSEILQKYLSDPAAYNYFICGPEGMMSHAKRQLAFLGVPKKPDFYRGIWVLRPRF